MRPVYFFILILFSSFLKDSNEVSSWIIERSSTLAIDGSSNINEFTCDIKEYLKTDTLRSITDQSKRKYLFTSNSVLSVEVRKFDCHQGYITSDFRKMLKYDVYPSLTIRFVSLDELRDKEVVKGLVEVELAGKKKKMDVTYYCSEMGANQVHLHGDKVMKFSDFELVPPRKIGGLIRINEDIKVHFNLYFRKFNS